MTVIVCPDQCGEVGRAGCEGHIPARPCAQRAGARIKIHDRIVECGEASASSTIFFSSYAHSTVCGRVVIAVRNSFAIDDWKPITFRQTPHKSTRRSNSFGVFLALRNQSPLRTLVQNPQKSFGVRNQALHNLSPIAASRGLIGLFDGHEHAKGKMKCPTRVLKDLTR